MPYKLEVERDFREFAAQQKQQSLDQNKEPVIF